VCPAGGGLRLEVHGALPADPRPAPRADTAPAERAPQRGSRLGQRSFKVPKRLAASAEKRRSISQEGEPAAAVLVSLTQTGDEALAVTLTRARQLPPGSSESWRRDVKEGR